MGETSLSAHSEDHPIMKGTSPYQMSNPEVVVNLWVYTDDAGFVARIAGKTYVLDGSDHENLAILRRLSATDFLSADWEQIPENFEVVGPEGDRLRYTQLSVLSDEYSKSLLFEQLLEKLSASVPWQLREVDGEYRRFKLQMPESPLTVLTVVIEHPDGQLVPMVKN